jgi:hypothetical protein
MIRFYNLLDKRYHCPLFVASATTRERVNPWGEVLRASKSPPDAEVSIIRVQFPDDYETLAYEVQGMMSAQSLLFPTGSSLDDSPGKPSGSPTCQISDIGPAKGANWDYCVPAQTPS